MQGLVTTERSNLDPAAVTFAKNPRDLERLSKGAATMTYVIPVSRKSVTKN